MSQKHVILKAEDAAEMVAKIRDLTYFYSYNRHGSDSLCVFCMERGQGPSDSIEHSPACDGIKFIALLEEQLRTEEEATKPCQRCQGNGVDPENRVEWHSCTCRDCGGTGVV